MPSELAMITMVLALMFHVIGSRVNAPPNSTADRFGFPLYLLGGLIFVFAFLDAGRLSVARRMDQHLPEWLFTDQLGSIGAILVILAMLYFAVRISAGLLRADSPGGSGAPVANAAR
jgi:cytochrome c oxidase subunit 1